MKKLPKSIWIIIISCFFLGVVIPFIINWLYSMPAPVSFLAMRWDAADVLGFYGSLLGAAATIFVLQQTIEFTKDSQKEDRKLSIKPRLETDWIPYAKHLLSLDQDEYLFVYFEENQITSSKLLPDRIATMLSLKKKLDESARSPNYDDYSFNEVTLNYATESFLEKNSMTLYEIRNYGAANAIDVSLQINGIEVCQRFCISTDQPKRIVLIVHENQLVNKHKQMDISLHYTDICSIGLYQQTETLHIRKNANSFDIIQNDNDYLSTPTELIRKDNQNG